MIIAYFQPEPCFYIRASYNFDDNFDDKIKLLVGVQRSEFRN